MFMSSWYVAIHGKQEGPFTKEHILLNLQNGVYTPSTFVWRQGFENWLEISQCAELVVTSSAAPPEPPSRSSHADEIDYQIFGNEMQFVEIEIGRAHV
jgi:hypothetical protein